MMSQQLNNGAIDAIVIGTSAGGIEALNVLLPALQNTSCPPIFIVVHVLRGRASMLAEIFKERCVLKVLEPEDKEPIVPGTIYFAPPDYHMLIGSREHVSLSIDEPINFSRPSIDVLFESAASVYKDRALGIILTGANSDGAAGIAAIHQRGGITVAQDPSEAVAPIMIQAALARIQPDYLLPLRGIAALIQSYKPH